jgi:hypothetical protein
MPLFLGGTTGSINHDSQQEHPPISVETDAYVDGVYAGLEGVERTSKYSHHRFPCRSSCRSSRKSFRAYPRRPQTTDAIFEGLVEADIDRPLT